MKYYNILLACSCAFAVTAASFVTAAPAKTENPADKAAMEKEKANREARKKLRDKLTAMRQEMINFTHKHQMPEAMQTVGKIVTYIPEYTSYGPYTNRDLDIFTQTIDFHFKKFHGSYAKEFKSCYEAIIPHLTGDVKVDAMTNYVQVLKLIKPVDQKTIDKVSAERFNVKDASPIRLFQIIVTDNELEKADALAEKTLKNEPDDKKKIGLLNTIIRAFLDKKVFGSDYANKYYKMKLALVTVPEEKAMLIHEYANFLKNYTIVSDEEAEKLDASRYQVEGLSKLSIAKCILQDVGDAPDTDIAKEIYLAGYEKMKADPEACLYFYQNIGRCRRGYGAMEGWINVFMRTVAFKSESVLHGSRWNYEWCMRSLIGNGFVGYVKENEAFFKGEVARTLKELQEVNAKYIPLQKKLQELQNECNALAENVKEIDAKIRAASKDPKALEELRKQRQTLEAKRISVSSLRDKTQQGLNALIDPVRDVSLRFSHATEGMIAYYKAIARRHYAKSDCSILALAVNTYDLKLQNPNLGDWDKCRIMYEALCLAYDAEMFDKVLAYVDKFAEFHSEKDKGAEKRFREMELKATFFRGFVAYSRENYPETVKILTDLAEGVKSFGNAWDQKGRYYEYLVRANVAIGDYNAALKYADQFIANAPRYMQKRYQLHVQELKERAAEAAKK